MSCFLAYSHLVSRINRIKTTLEDLGRTNNSLQEQISELQEALNQQRDTSIHAESALEEAVKCNESLLQQLHDRQDDHNRQEDLSERLAATEAEFSAALDQARKENEALKEQLARQEKEFLAHQELLMEQVALAKADRRDIKVRA